MKDDKTVRLIRGHRASLDRYARLLATGLTDFERQYIHRRIAEEHAAIMRLEAQRLATTVATMADTGTLAAVRAAAQQMGSSEESSQKLCADEPSGDRALAFG